MEPKIREGFATDLGCCATCCVTCIIWSVRFKVTWHFSRYAAFPFHLVLYSYFPPSETYFLTNRLFRHVLFNFKLFIDFLITLLLFISRLIPIWSESMCWMTSFKLKKILRYVFCPRISLILVSVQWATEKNILFLLDMVFYIG